MSWYKIRAKAAAKDTTEVLIYGDIGESWWAESVTASAFVRELQAIDTANLDVRINSFGGSVPDGLAIYNALRRFPGVVNVYIDGVALSIASLIAMAGQTVTMAANAQFMIHAPWAGVVGNANELRVAADVLDGFSAGMSKSYATKTGTPVQDMLALLTDGVDHWYGAAEAKAAGFVDEVTDDVVEAVASARVPKSRFPSAPAAAAAFMAHKEQSMPSKNPAASGTATDQKDGQAPEQQAAVTPAASAVVPYARSDAESAEIRTMFAPFAKQDGVQALLVNLLAQSTVSPSAASAKLLAHLGQGNEPARPAGAAPHIETLADETDRRRGAVVNALLARSGVRVEAQHLDGNPYRGHRLLDIARASLDSIGFNTRGLTQMEIVAAAFTQGTSDFPVLLENTMHKSLLAAYALAPDTWSRFCAVGSVSDFRAHNRYRIGSFGNLDTVNELAEFKNKSIPDGEKVSITASTKGNIINLSRQAVINDDLGAFVGLAGMLGRAARRSIEADVYTLLTSNTGAGPTLNGTAMFHSTRGNLAASAAAPTVALVDAGRAAMAIQKDVSLNDYLDLRPAIALTSMAVGSTMRVLNDAQYDPDTANKLQRPNSVRGLVREVIDTPRLSGNAWYLLADPNVAPIIEVAFLDGVQEPYIELQNGFEVDGARYKVRLDYGVAGIDWRGAYQSPAS
jgi:ATP-dependent protease ClpP protease subunit